MTCVVVMRRLSQRRNRRFRAQAEEACAQPASTRFVPREVSDACTVLTNLVSPDIVTPDVEDDARVAEACAAGLPWVLMELLDERSAMFGAVRGSAANALVMVLRLLRILLNTESGRDALPVHEFYDSDGYDHEDAVCEDYASDALLQRLALLAHFHPHGTVKGGAAFYAFSAYCFSEKAFDDDPVTALGGIVLREDKSREAALRLGWDISAGSNVTAMMRVHPGAQPTTTWSTPEDASATLSGFAVDKGGNHVRCAACKREHKWGEDPFKVCSACRVPHYCTKECQRAHWRAQHKRECPGSG